MDNNFYGIEDGALPAFIGTGDDFTPISEVPQAARIYMSGLLEHLRGLHAENPAAFEAVIGFVFTAIREREGNR